MIKSIELIYFIFKFPSLFFLKLCHSIQRKLSLFKEIKIWEEATQTYTFITATGDKVSGYC